VPLFPISGKFLNTPHVAESKSIQCHDGRPLWMSLVRAILTVKGLLTIGRIKYHNKDYPAGAASISYAGSVVRRVSSMWPPTVK
jgi:hypothetical protein